MVLFGKAVVNPSMTTGSMGVLFSKSVVNTSVTTGPVWCCSVEVWSILV